MLNRICKRALDIVVSGTALALLAPVLAVAAGAIRLRLGAPVLFGQVRPGYRGRPFTIYKLRTMVDRRDADGKPLPDRVRMTPLGRLLRDTSIDEIPELFNVLKGEMSLVGPRPLRMEYLQLYTPEQARRHDVKPGLTGWAQVHGRNATTWEERFAYDLWYVDHQNFWLDLKILAMTVPAVLRRDGISQPGHVSMARFGGSPKANA
jgi:sugar transferase EpsL